MTVLVLAQNADAPTDHVVATLSRRGIPVLRADSSWFPQRLTLTAETDSDGHWSGSLRTEDRDVDLRDIRSVWYRDPSAFLFPSGMTDVEKAYAHREARLGLGGVLAALPHVLWVNHPNRAADAMYKPVQLALAAACGLRVPPTLVTNSADAVRSFSARMDGAVVQKSLGPNTVTEGGRTRVAFTRRFAAEQEDLRGVAVTATQVQRWVDKSSEARIVAVGTTLFAIRIMARSPAARIDWRADYAALDYEVIAPPPEVVDGIHVYMRNLGLNYAAFDFGIDADEQYWFYESNSGGQYGWLESRTGVPITEALADLLQGEHT